MGERAPGLREIPTAVQRFGQESGATVGRADWRHDATCACAAKVPAERGACRDWGVSGVAGYPSRVLPEPDVDK